MYVDTLTPKECRHFNVTANRKLEQLKALKNKETSSIAPVRDELTEEVAVIMSKLGNDTVLHHGDKYLYWNSTSRIQALTEENTSIAIGEMSVMDDEQRNATLSSLNVSKMLKDRERNRRKKAAKADSKAAKADSKK